MSGFCLAPLSCNPEDFMPREKTTGVPADHVHRRTQLLLPALLLLCILPPSAMAIECYECHGSKSPTIDYRPIDDTFRNHSTGGFQGNHRAHVGNPLVFTECARCHPGSGSYTSSHRDGMISLAPNINNSPQQALYRNATTPFPQTTAPNLGSCTNVNCHFERTTPPWGSTFPPPADCSSCHGYPPSGGSSGAAGAHALHNSYYPAPAGCSACHAGHTTFTHATSVSRGLIVAPRHPADSQAGSYSGPVNDYLPSQSNQFGSCSAFYCHSNGTAVATQAAPVATTPVWDGVTDCASCHGSPPGYANNAPKKNSHGRHPYTCNRCHATTTSNGSLITDFARHVNKAYDVAPGPGIAFTYTFAATGGTCTNVSCHSDGTNIASGILTTNAKSWGSPAFACNGCHGYPPNYATGSLKANSHSAPEHAQFFCSKCHSQTTTNGATITTPANHLNGAYTVTPAVAGLFTYIYAPNGGTCTAVGCHFDNADRQWGVPLNCGSCHDSPPQTPAHLKHFSGTLADAAYGDVRITAQMNPNATGYLFNCGNCHPMDKAKHKNGLVDVELYNANAPAGSPKRLSQNASYAPGTDIFFDSRNFAYTKGNCSNIYCHSAATFATTSNCDGTDNASQEACEPVVLASLTVGRKYQTPTWEGTLPGDCSGCHENAPRLYPETNNGGAGSSHAWVNPNRDPLTNLEQPYTIEQGHFNKTWFNINPITCNFCHNDTVKAESRWGRGEPYWFTSFSSVPIASHAKHVNGMNDVAFDRTKPYAMTYSDWWGNQKTVNHSLTSAGYDPATKTCSNVSCHKGQTSVRWGTPYWGDKAWEGIDYTCWKCHPSGYY
jgi:predicted CxxxxCH...CXXCH cytochrome family protein